MPDKTTQPTTPPDRSASDARTLRAATRRYVRHALGKPDDDETDPIRLGKERKPVLPFTHHDVVGDPQQEQTLVVDAAGFCRFCRFTEAETRWWKRSNELDDGEIEFSLAEQETLRRTTNRKIELRIEGLHQFFTWMDPIDAKILQNRCPETPALSRRSSRGRQNVAIGQFNENEAQVLKKVVKERMKNDQPCDRDSLVRALQDSPRLGDEDPIVRGKLLRNKPEELHAYFEEVSDQLAALRRRDRVIEERVVDGDVVEIWSDLPSIKSRIAYLGYIAQRIQNDWWRYSTADVLELIAGARAGLPPLEVVRIGIKGISTFRIEVVGSDGKVKR